MGLQDKLADARRAAERARAQQQEWSQGRHEAKEQQALARQETEALEKAAVDARVAEEGWWTHPDAFKAFGRSGSLPVTKCDYLGGWSDGRVAPQAERIAPSRKAPGCAHYHRPHIASIVTTATAWNPGATWRHRLPTAGQRESIGRSLRWWLSRKSLPQQGVAPMQSTIS